MLMTLLTLGLMQIAMQMAKTEAEFCIAHLHRICIKTCIGSRASVVAGVTRIYK